MTVVRVAVPRPDDPARCAPNLIHPGAVLFVPRLGDRLPRCPVCGRVP